MCTPLRRRSELLCMIPSLRFPLALVSITAHVDALLSVDADTVPLPPVQFCVCVGVPR